MARQTRDARLLDVGILHPEQGGVPKPWGAEGEALIIGTKGRPVWGPTGGGFNFLRRAGDVGGKRIRYCAGNVFHAGGFANQTVSANTLPAWPFYSGLGGVVDILGFEVTTAVVSTNARVGIYNSAQDSTIYPSSLLVDGGDFSCAATGHKEATSLSVTLLPDRLYWFALVANSSTVGFRGFNIGTSTQGGLWDILGIDANTHGLGWTAGHTYGALPDPYPASASVLTTVALAVSVRFSSYG